MNINLPSSKPQADVASYLEQFRKLHLQQALSSAIQSLELGQINQQLDELAPAPDLRALASRGIRGEFVFAISAVLTARPKLLGYSQKEFYQKSRLGRFETLESDGHLPERFAGELPALCRALNTRASEMLAAIGFDRITLDLLDDLSLLTLGPQLRGSLNTRIGRLANRTVFEIIQHIVQHAVQAATEARLELRNASGRKVIITFSADPDISIVEEIPPHTLRNLVAIEIKGGTNKSNIWNRLGEAEKSHQSARHREFREFWTIYNVPDLDLVKAREKSPTTSRFYSLPRLSDPTTEEYNDFRARLLSLVGIPAQPQP
jgi:hypothetical protein